jgi:hypothetical protein
MHERHPGGGGGRGDGSSVILTTPLSLNCPTAGWAWARPTGPLPLKGHGNEADFLGFFQKLVPHESLTLPFGPFRFWLRIRGDIRIRKPTPRYR